MSFVLCDDTVKRMNSRDDKKYLSKTAIKDRGWTEGAIKKFLGEPDKLAKNKRSSRTKVHLYLEDRVVSMESTDEWKEWFNSSLKRRNALRDTNAKKRQKTVEKAEEVLSSIGLSKKARGKSYGKLKLYAAKNYVEFNNMKREHRGDFEFLTVDEVLDYDDTFQQRNVVNWLRHNGTTYDSQLEKYFNQVGAAKAKDLVRERIYSLISMEYPWLAGECERQLGYRREQYEDELKDNKRLERKD